MPQLIRPAATTTIVTKEGEVEITLNINITINGVAVNTETLTDKDEAEAPVHFVPDFASGLKLPSFGKKEN